MVRFTEMAPGAESPMHRTETVDVGVVLEGETWLLLDDGSETRVGAGDAVVQRGTNHAWANRSDRPVRMVFVMIDGSDHRRAARGGGAVAVLRPGARLDTWPNAPRKPLDQARQNESRPGERDKPPASQLTRSCTHHAANASMASASPPKIAVSIPCRAQKWLAGW